MQRGIYRISWTSFKRSPKSCIRRSTFICVFIIQTRLSNEEEQAEVYELWKTLQTLSDKDRIKREAKELMVTDEGLLRQKENDLELLIVRLNVDETEVRNKSKAMKLLQEKAAEP